ncbi:mucolipin-3 [Aplysia californica]|uniref:Mucolipin-3 n=1 Tax=Aplysia californica TaxID=6500 RepID=A0ABM0JRL6_APLCA|nr:mucolipin-3 [Aplysia californica]
MVCVYNLMQTSHHYIARPRSRSPSPVSFQRDSDAGQKRRTRSGHSGSVGASDGLLHVQGPTLLVGDEGEENYGSRDGARINELLHHSQPVDALVTVRGDSPDIPAVSVKELLDRSSNPKRRHSSGEMDELAGAVRNYGSINPGERGQTDGSSNTDRSDAEHNGHVPTRSASESGRPRRLSRQKSYYTPAMVDELRKRNRLYFLDPITKLKHFHGFPWKLTLQIIKVLMLTTQVVIFGAQRETMVEYFEGSDLSFKHLLLNGWDPSYETMPYPPATGQYAIYTLGDLLDHMNNVSERYYTMPNSSLASMHLYQDNVTGEVKPIELCFRANKYVEFDNGTYIVSADVLHNCTFIRPYGPIENRTYDIQKYLKEHNFSLPYDRVLEISLGFKIRTFHLNLLETHYGPTCYNVEVEILYENKARSGQLLVDLQTTRTEVTCFGKIMSPEAEDEMESLKMKYIAFDAAVIATCCLSTILCSRSLKRSNKLRMDTAKYFRLQRGRPLSFSNHLEFINMWYIIIIINDIFTCIGSALKMQLESRSFSISSENYEICSMVIGLGIFLSYVGILRYLGFFKSYNVLMLTLKTSFPHVLRFLVCAVCLYMGFLFCGWVVFSPFHIKFRKLSTASECLFSLVNGDDMFVTFSALTNNSNSIFYFHRAYLYIFISLFIYVVLSVFIAVIMDNYENLKHYYEKGFPETEIQKFMKENGEMPVSELFNHVRRDGTWQSWFFCFFPCLACLRSEPSMRKMSQDRRELLATI